MVHAEPRERRVECSKQMQARRVETAFTIVSGHGLGGQHDLVASDLTEQRPEDLLGTSIGVHIGRVDQVAPRVQERTQLIGGFVLVGVATPGHGAQGQSRHVQARTAQGAVLHGV